MAKLKGETLNKEVLKKIEKLIGRGFHLAIFHENGIESIGYKISTANLMEFHQILQSKIEEKLVLALSKCLVPKGKVAKKKVAKK